MTPARAGGGRRLPKAPPGASERDPDDPRSAPPVSAKHSRRVAASDAETPSAVVARRVLEVRERQRLTQQDLADLLRDRGVPVDRATVARVETGSRGISVDDLTLFATALGISPIALLVPLSDDSSVRVTPNLVTPSGAVREWVRGHRQLPGAESRVFRQEVADSEWVATQNSNYRELRALVHDLAAAVAEDNVDDCAVIAHDIADLATTLERGFQRAKRSRQR